MLDDNVKINIKFTHFNFPVFYIKFYNNMFLCKEMI